MLIISIRFYHYSLFTVRYDGPLKDIKLSRTLSKFSCYSRIIFKSLKKYYAKKEKKIQTVACHVIITYSECNQNGSYSDGCVCVCIC